MNELILAGIIGSIVLYVIFSKVRGGQTMEKPDEYDSLEEWFLGPESLVPHVNFKEQ